MRNSETASTLPGLHLQTSVRPDEQASVRDLLLFLWRNRWIALASAAICAIGAAVASWIATPQYTAAVALLPVAGESGSMGLGSLGSAVSQLSGLASLAGVRLGGAEGAKTEALATLQSEVLTDTYVQQHDLLPVLFPNEWDARTKQWKTRDPEKIPTLWKANQLFKGRIRNVDDDPKTGLITLSIRWKDPAVAAQWANGLVKLTNDYLRQKSIDEAERSITYLKQEITRTNIVEVKNAIYMLMEEEIKKEMLARGRDEFALRVVDPAVPPERKSYPKPLLWIIGGVIAGIFFGFLGCVVRETLVDERSPAGHERHSRPASPQRLTDTMLESTDEHSS